MMMSNTCVIHLCDHNDLHALQHHSGCCRSYYTRLYYKCVLHKCCSSSSAARTGVPPTEPLARGAAATASAWNVGFSLKELSLESS